MNKKGFTLIELVAVIAIIAILGLVVVPIVTNVLSNNSETMDKNQEQMIKEATKNYVIKNAFKYNSDESGYVDCVTVEQLKSEGYLDYVTLKSHNSNVDYNNYRVEIFRENNSYKYELSSGNCPLSVS